MSWATPVDTHDSQSDCTERERQLSQRLLQLEDMYKEAIEERNLLGQEVEMISAVGIEQLNLIKTLQTQQAELRQLFEQSQASLKSAPPPVASSQGARRKDINVPRYELSHDWKIFVKNFMEIVEANKWEEHYACLMLKLSLSTEARGLVEQIEDLPEDVLLKQLASRMDKIFREEFQEGKAKTKFLERKKSADETFKKFYLDLCKLYRQAHPSSDSAQHQDVTDRFILGCGDEELSSYLWDNRRKPPLELVEMAESKCCFKQQYALAKRSENTQGVADADLFAYDTRKNQYKGQKDKKGTDTQTQPSIGVTESQVVTLADTVAKSVANEFGARLSTELTSWRGRNNRGRGRGRGYQKPYETQPPKNEVEENKPGNAEGAVEKTATLGSPRRKPNSFFSNSL